MKNRGLFCLVLICCICIAFTVGLFVGRNFNHSEITLSTVPASTAAAESSTNVPSQLLNINTATADQLQQLPGIGPTLAQRILEYRQLNGPFSSVAELVNVSGIGESKLESILEYITVGG